MLFLLDKKHRRAQSSQGKSAYRIIALLPKILAFSACPAVNSPLRAQSRQRETACRIIALLPKILAFSACPAVNSPLRAQSSQGKSACRIIAILSKILAYSACPAVGSPLLIPQTDRIDCRTVFKNGKMQVRPRTQSRIADPA